MSKSLMDAIRQTITEGARDKTSDGMTKDAKHFAQELHKVSDAGFKHMVQKDSETSDYAKMFNGDVDKAPTRPADYEPGQDLDKYVEYNEHVEIDEAKKKADKHDDDCDCDDCSSEEDVKEAAIVTQGMLDASRKAASPVPKSRANVEPKSLPGKALNIASARGGAGIAPYNTDRSSGFKPKPAAPPAWGAQAAERLRSKPAAPAAPTTTPKSPMAGQGTSALPKSPMAGQGTARPGPKSPMAGQGTSALPKSPMAGQGTSGAAKPPAAKPMGTAMGSFKPDAVKPMGTAMGSFKPDAAKKPASPSTGVVKKKAAPSTSGVKKDAAPVAPKSKPKTPVGMGSKEAIGGSGKPNIGKGGITVKQPARAAKRAPVGMKSESFEIDINGTSYLVSEAHASAIAAFVEKYGEVNEVLTKSTTAGETVSDFVHSKNPKFKGKSKNKRIQMALASYYDRQRK